MQQTTAEDTIFICIVFVAGEWLQLNGGDCDKKKEKEKLHKKV